MDHYLDIVPVHGERLPEGVRVVMVAPASADATARETLANIVKACGLTEGTDCATVYLAGPAAFRHAATPSAAESDIQWVVVFGIQPKSVGLAAEVVPYRWTPVLGGRRYCFAERLSLIGEDMERKKRLWSTIKSLKG